MKKIPPLFRRTCGFTLIETLVVIVSLILIMVSGSSLFFSSIIGSAKVAALREVRQNGQYALKTMEELIKNSQGLVSCTSGVYPPTSPDIVVKDVSGNQITFKVIEDKVIEESSHYKIASQSGGLTYFLTSNKVNVDTFEIECGDAMHNILEGKSPTVSLKFGLSQGNIATDPKFRTAQMSFDTNITIRIPFKATNP